MNYAKIIRPLLFIGAYVLSVLVVNIGFSYVPLISTPLGMLSPMAVIVGTTFVFRDYAQRYSGHWVLIGMVIGAILSFALADPYVALASLAAFVISEGVDYVLYTVTKKPFRDRVILSSSIATPLDTAVFLLGISAFSWGTFVLMVLSKMIASAVIYFTAKSDNVNSEGIEDPLPA